MSANACRICLAMDVKLYSIKRELLKTAVEIILPLECDPPSFPQFMCYECTAVILKCLKLIEKSRLSETILYNIYDMQGEISHSALRAVNRQSANLESKLKIHNCTPNSYIEIVHYDDIESPSNSSIEIQQYNIEEDSNAFIDIHNYDIEGVPRSMEIISMDQVSNSIESEPFDIEQLENNESHLILSLDDDRLGDAATEVDLDNEILLETGENEALFVFDVDLNLEKNNLESIALSLPKSNESSMNYNKKEKQTKPKTKTKERKAVQPKSKDLQRVRKTTKDGQKNVKRRKKIKDCDATLRKHFNIVMLTHEEQMAEVEARKQEPGYANSPYKCAKCFRYYRKAEAYWNHMQEHHHSRGSSECAVCKKMFASRLVMERHVVCCHQRHYHCKLCPYTGKNRQALVHLKKHQGDDTVLKCALCKFVCHNLSRMSRHMSLRHGRARAGVRCLRCGRRFATQRGHRQHERRALCRDYTETEHIEYSCGLCASTFTKESEWKKHLQDKHKEKKNFCKRCNESFLNTEEFAKHNTALHRSENEYPVICSHCNEIIRSSTLYWRHIVRNHPTEKKNYHSPKRTFLCDICGKGFKSVTDLKFHTLRHTSRRAVPCPECSALFYDHYQARIHRKNVHSDQRPHQCPTCNQTFKIKSNLTRHMVVHTGERAHKCSLCSKSFTQAGSRDLHVRAVHYKIPYPSRSSKKQKEKADNSENVDESESGK